MEQHNERQFLVIGTAIPEMVIHKPHGGTRTGIGGVAATMAMALAEAGNQVTLLTTIGQGPHALDLRQHLKDAPFRAMVLNRSHSSGHAQIETLGGQHHTARGSWPRLTTVAKAAAKLAPHHEAVLVDCNVASTDLFQILDHPHTLRIINGTTSSACKAILDPRFPEGTIIALNDPETRAVSAKLGTDSPAKLATACKAAGALLTKGAKGWTYYNGNDLEVHSEAVEVPPNTDFVGCGDYAAAGLAHALLHGQDIRSTVNDFITRKLNANVVDTAGPAQRQPRPQG